MSADTGIMEIDFDAESDRTPETNENGFVCNPVLPDESGEGLPYAPVNWPNPGDNWRWKVGKRVSAAGHFLDRYLYLPKRLRNREHSTRRKYGFASKLAVERYIKATFPGLNLDDFFTKFSWRIPAHQSALTNGSAKLKHVSRVLPPEECAEPDYMSDTERCKAGNKKCSSLLEQAESPVLAVMECDICCTEPKFCRDCCCILCCKSVNSSCAGYDYIRCEALMHDGSICGHAAHIDCALRCYMAGTVGGSIGLDSEYYCRRCDEKTDLVSHVTRLLLACESLDSRDDVEKILNFGICILRGSQKTSARDLLKRIEVAIEKLKCGTNLEDIWKEGDNFSTISTDVSHHGDTVMELTGFQEPLDVRGSQFYYRTEAQKLEEEIDQVLHALRRSQETEFKMAEECLNAQKNYLCNLYQQLEKEKSDLVQHASTDSDALLSTVMSRVKQIKSEVKKLKDMEEVANGFGKTSRAVLKEHFSLAIED
ncbi:hypothetical protein ACFX13_012743 [Malus domestica]|uniref:protein OBERON 1 isoform X1 n=2 Tax=Malus sylvestris TaxID=3752 RepID=UPI0021AC747E|nr:protein OBERON 1 isoform X1 [Malus sylvestris]